MASNSLDVTAMAVTARTKTLVNNVLKRICKEEGQIQSGNKVHLQSRIIGMINRAAINNDAETLNRLRYRVHNNGSAPPPGTDLTSLSAPSQSSASMSGYNNMSNGYGQQSSQSNQTYSSHSLGAGSTTLFKTSPFYQIRELLFSGITLEASPSHRQSVNKPLPLTEATCTRLKTDPSMRLLLFSAPDQPLSQFSRIDVAFPSQIEVKINGDEVKANYKGLKNKPGSTRPADITDLMRKVANYRNSLQITYALTQKGSPQKFNFYIYLVRKDTIDELAKKIQQRNVITKASVLNEMRKKADDPDIEVGSVNLSLKDPISTLRISMPIRSTVCSHNQCFDAESFLQLQEQAPTWTCPICNKSVSYEGLAVDEYVQEILSEVSRSTDQVTIDPMGNWSRGNKNENGSSRTSGYLGGYNPSEGDDDDDLVEIVEPRDRVAAIKSEAVPTPQSLAQTPPLQSREPSNTPRGQKRKSEVIDLTLSDDDEPVRPAKKVAYSTPNSLPDPSRRYQTANYGSASLHSRPQQPSPVRHRMGSASGQDQLPPLSHTPSQQQHHIQYAYRPPTEVHGYPGHASNYPTYANLDGSP
ncbi:E3 SUMO-protein ligase PIAS1 [Aaosphaeria arxii CBS 175.79]|uniref:E3 SUMO-protein ligase PIAS1 n=1 Tax=Aaosphaeria arxii CBS 175.79 TaxID=1450172 RepID=A0A6A5XHN7_9PLEO|nr:E3 SUMO-protein ligase PIAS1 [Aaosphaeria arxii CBS 175.79]KAF2012483.1 E3 SUMO-protein ligase PIAS1 [Aaosphaeria arxii CBS 175.79]